MRKLGSHATIWHGKIIFKITAGRQHLPSIININGRNHNGQPADAEPSAHVTFRVPLERYFFEQSPEKESKRRFERLQKKKVIYCCVTVLRAKCLTKSQFLQVASVLTALFIVDGLILGGMGVRGQNLLLPVSCSPTF